MSKFKMFFNVLAASASVALLSASASPSRADLIYGYSQQTVTGLVVSGSGITDTSLTGTASSANVVFNGVGVATNSPSDTAEAYAGAPPAAPQNSFVKYATAGGGPQAGAFSRGDSILSGASSLFTTGASLSAVAESYVNPLGDAATSSGISSLTGTFRSTGPSIQLSYNYANDILAEIVGTPGSATSFFSLAFSVTDQHGHTVSTTPSNLTRTLSAPPNGPEFITSGSGAAVLSLAALTGGDLYTLTITNTANVSLTNTAGVSAVPLPAGVWAGLSCLGMYGLVVARKRKGTAS